MYALSRLLDTIFPPRDTDLLVREATLELLLMKMDPITLHGGFVTALLPYRDPLVHALVIEAKYHGNTRASALLAGALADYLLENAYEETAIERRPIALVPLPLSGARMRMRGYNQVTKILRAALPSLGETAAFAPSVLSRVRDTLPQTRLARNERKENVAGAFVAKGVDTRLLYIVVDDVVTTGATLREAVDALTKEGAHVRALALAY